MGWLLELLVNLIADLFMLALPRRVWFGCLLVMIVFLITLFGWLWYGG